MTATEREAERTALVDFLRTLHADGRPVPCLTPDRRDRALWTSEDDEEQAFAARLCVRCAGATRCGLYGQSHPREFGVYGGATNQERQPRRGRPSKGAAA